MKLMVLTAGVWPTEEEARRKLWIFLASCRKFGIEPAIYGMGTPQFPGYRAMMLDMQLDFLKTVPEDYSHILFHDGADAFFTAGPDEIIRKYQDMGSPEMLCSAFYQLANVSDVDLQYPNCFDTSKRYCFPNRGGYLAERKAIIDAFDRMLALPRQTGDDCFNWYDLWATGWRPTLDSECQIFQIAEDDIEVEDGLLHNTYTGSNPCVLHLSGGYSSQSNGKDERMIPWAVKLGIIECPHQWARRRDGRWCVNCGTVEFGV